MEEIGLQPQEKVPVCTVKEVLTNNMFNIEEFCKSIDF